MRGFCDFCGKSIAAKRYVKYCSDACKMKAYRRRKDELVGSSVRNHERIKNAVMTKHDTTVKSVCEQCGLEYWRTGTQALQMYCSDACKQKAYRARKKEVSHAWKVGDRCLTENGYEAVITRIDGTQYARTEERINGKWLPGMRSLAKLRPLVAADAPAVPLFKIGDIVEVNHQTSILNGMTGRVRGPLKLANGVENGNLIVDFDNFGHDGRATWDDFAPEHLTLIKSVEKQDAEFDNLLRTFGWVK